MINYPSRTVAERQEGVQQLFGFILVWIFTDFVFQLDELDYAQDCFPLWKSRCLC